MQISIALATYNGARFLREQLASYTAQTLPPYEVVVCDDGSTDGTPELVEAYARAAPFPVRLVRNEATLGYRTNFLRAASLCSGAWVAFSDQDDVWLPEKLARTAEAARLPGVRLVAHSAALTSETLEPTGERFPRYRRQVVEPLGLRPLGVVTGFVSAFDRELLDGVPWEARPHDANAPGHRLAHDQFIPFLANVLGRTAFLPDVLALYRRHGAAETGAAGTGAYDLTLRHYVRERLKSRADDYRALAEAAGEHVRFLAGLEAVRPAAELPALRAGAAYYGTLADAYARRVAVYEPSARRRQRVGAWLRLVRAGRYGSVRGGAGMGYAALAKDGVSAFAV